MRVLNQVFVLVLFVLLGGCISPPPKVTPVSDSARHKLPKKFAWGLVSSSYQFEDPDVIPGTKAYFQTDWDLLIAKRKAPPKGNAVFSWSHFEKDLAALKKIRPTHYRFSIEWARVEPQPGVFNEEAIREYQQMAIELRRIGVEPVVCLWHFTFPDWLTDKKRPVKSNWLHPDFEKSWERYLRKIVPAMARHARYFAPQNEPNGQITTAYLANLWPPRRFLDFASYRKAIDVSAVAFIRAASIVRQYRKDAIVLSIEAMPWWHREPFDFTAAFYNQMLRSNFDHLDRVYRACDIVGINYYYCQWAAPLAFLTVSWRHGPNYSMMGWRIDPEGLYRQIQTVSRRYGLPMMITENGIATKNEFKRIKYLRDHIDVVQRARRDGYDVRGYFVWSLVDNYEWHYGYKAFFGLAYMNPRTLDREFKPSAYFYRDTIKAGHPPK